MKLTFQIIDEQAARSILNWRYEPPYDFYNSKPERLESDLETLLKPENQYYTFWDENNTLIGHCCFGKEAQVAGGNYDQNALDLGMELHPDRTGQRQGTQFIQAVIEFAKQKFQTEILRVTIALFNQRALRAWQKAGFEANDEFSRQSDYQQFVVLTRRV